MREHEPFVQAGTSLRIDTAHRQLSYYQGKKAATVFPVAVGKPSTPTPVGNYRVINKLINPGGVLGTRWLGLDIPGGNYGIHGTNNPHSIGKAVSNGCVRMFNHHIESLFPHVNIGTPVMITVGQGKNNNPKNGNRRTYIVQPGDTLWKIARRAGVPLDTLVQANPQVNPELILPGQVIVIPDQK